MPPMAPIDLYVDTWEEDPYDSPISIDCLMPNGILIPMELEREITLADIKEELWREAQRYPLYNKMSEKNRYIFMCVNSMGERIELMDEGKRLLDVRPFDKFLKVIEKKGNRAETIKNAHISALIGKGLNELETIKISEVSDFRQRMRHVCEHIALKREGQTWEEKVQYQYPPELDDRPELPPHITEKFNGQSRKYSVGIRIYEAEISFTFSISFETKPKELTEMALQKWETRMGQSRGKAVKYVLKSLGREEYLLGDYPVSQLKFVRIQLKLGSIPQLLLVDREQLQVDTVPPPRGITSPGYRVPPTIPSRRNSVKSNRCMFDMTEQYSIDIHQISNLALDDHRRIRLLMGLFHGWESICAPVSFECTVGQNVATIDAAELLNKDLAFDLPIQHIPRMARLCFTLFSIVDRKANRKTIGSNAQAMVKLGKTDAVPMSWVNIPVFDYRGRLRSGTTGTYKLPMWSVTNDDVLSEDLLNPIGTVECNPKSDEAVEIEFSLNSKIFHPVNFPSFEKVMEVAAKSKSKSEDSVERAFNEIEMDKKELYLNNLQVMIDRDPLHPLEEHEKNMIWMLREECIYHFPHSLPKLLKCVEWNNYVSVCQMQSLLQVWQRLTPTQALELLDFHYADQSVRKFAVQCLEPDPNSMGDQSHGISDSELLQYLLQLVQVLKYESYLDCDLVEFLLKRALSNQRIGQYFFWLLRSEMHVSSVSVRFGLILEAYCRGISNMDTLLKQVEALARFKNLAKCLQAEKFKNIMNVKTKKEAMDEMKKMLQQKFMMDTLSDLRSPLNPSYYLRKLRNDRCKFMQSKMRPLWLVWQNKDTLSEEDVYLMYKSGDDLRQDMLTLQILRIMDNLWQSEGLDLRLNAYQCLATGMNEGFIEIVQDALTLASIHGLFGSLGAFKQEGLYKWLHNNNKDENRLNKAIEEFTLSCAGYCVATYVLGIADRHSDNIMLKKNGQLFHIDFGHILGNFKVKFGYKKEKSTDCDSA